MSYSGEKKVARLYVFNAHVPTTIGEFHKDLNCLCTMPGHVFLEDQTKCYFERREM